MSALDINQVLPGVQFTDTAVTIPLSSLPGIKPNSAADLKKAIDEAYYEAYAATDPMKRPRNFRITQYSSDPTDIVYTSGYVLQKAVLPPVADEPPDTDSGSGSDGGDTTSTTPSNGGTTDSSSTASA